MLLSFYTCELQKKNTKHLLEKIQLIKTLLNLIFFCPAQEIELHLWCATR